MSFERRFRSVRQRSGPASSPSQISSFLRDACIGQRSVTLLIYVFTFSRRRTSTLVHWCAARHRKKHRMHTFIDALRTLRTNEEYEMFLQTLLTPKELAAVSNRWRIMQLLMSGHTQRQIVELSGTATATVASQRVLKLA